MTEPLTPDELAAIEKRCNAATPLLGKDTDDAPCFEADDDGVTTIKYLDEETADFIAASRTDVPRLLAEVKRLRGIIDDYDIRPDC